ncbi:MAG: hypothetical protein ABIS50_18935 [Luteolibacter sp.]|uniref:hypothetical protein n=1 Tax=Luteolibacter sp. TaxID=1962973 RepID=UPI003264376A
MKFPLSAITILVISTALLKAQNKTASPEQDKPLLAAPIRISLLAVGDPPQPHFDVTTEKRTLQETPASDYPPSKVFLRDRSEKEKAFKEVSLGLNAATGYVVYKGESTLNLYRGETGDEKGLYASLPIPELHADMTIMLTRNTSKKSWETDPKARFFDNSLTSFPQDSARYVNLSSVPIRVVNGKDPVFEIAPGGFRVVPLQRSEQGILAYRIAAAVDAKIFPIADTATTYTPDTRINLVAYNADGENKTQPVKVIRFFERPPQVAEKKEKE